MGFPPFHVSVFIVLIAKTSNKIMRKEDYLGENMFDNVNILKIVYGCQSK